MKTIKTSLLSAAVAGLLFGATSCKKDENPAPAGANNTPNKGAPVSNQKVSPAALAIKEKHACKTLNDCKHQGGCKTAKNDCAGKNDCGGKGGCATVEHSCAKANACKSQGGCQGKAGKNDCTGKGGCGVPVKAH
jgi:hypothetical protein